MNLKAVPLGLLVAGAAISLFAQNGSPDASFQAEVNATVRTMVVQPDGKLLIGGGFTSVNGVPRNRIARLEADGELDIQFDPGQGASGPVYAIALQSDGRILVGGDFGLFAGANHPRLVRLNTNGTLDASFALSAPPTAAVRAICLQTNQDLNQRNPAPHWRSVLCSLIGAGSITSRQWLTAKPMSNSNLLCRAVLMVFSSAAISFGEIQVVSERNDSADASAAFQFQNVPRPARGDAAANAKFTLVDGVIDPNSGGLATLNDGRLPTEDDQPARNFFFSARTAGGRLHLDLGSVIEIKQINTYSWHAGLRGPQVYQLYASDGATADFNPRPTLNTDPAQGGWKLIAKVDTRPASGDSGGQYGVSVFDSAGNLGQFRHLLFAIARTTADDPFDNTFYSEIDAVDANAPAIAETELAVAATPVTHVFDAQEGKYQFTLDTTVAPDLTEWAEKELKPVVQEWYPKIVEMLPSEGFTAPARVTILFRDNMGGTPASASGSRINCNVDWFRRNLKGEAIGSVVHEMVHVVQQYGRARRGDPNVTRPPGWLVEGIPDYIRWFLYEPQTRGAEITSRNFARARYDASYRVTGNFLNWAVETHGKELVVNLNAAARQGRYREDLWKDHTGKTVQELGEEWREAHRIRLGLPVDEDTPAN